jgi:hypothetical protein
MKTVTNQATCNFTIALNAQFPLFSKASKWKKLVEKDKDKKTSIKTQGG